MAGAIDLFAGQIPISGTNLFKVDKSPLDQIDTGIEDVIGQHGANTGDQILQAIIAAIEALFGLKPGSSLDKTFTEILSDLSTYFGNLLTFLGELNPLDPSFDPVKAIENFITSMLKPTNLIAMLVSDANLSGGVTGFIPLENLALDLIQGGAQSVQALIDAILAAFGFGPGTGTTAEVDKLFHDFYAFLGNPSGWATNAFDAVSSVENFITTMINPTNLLAPLESLFAGSFTVPAINIPGLDASKITSGQFASTMIQDLQSATSALEQWLVPYVPIGAIAAGTPNLLPNPNYKGAQSVSDPTGRWTWDPNTDHTGDGSGSVLVHANGVSTQLVSQAAVPVGQGQQLQVSHYLEWSGVVGSGQCFTLGLLTFNSASVLLGSQDLASVSNPAASSGWTQLSGNYTVPAGVAGVQVLLTIGSSATAGTIHWDDASLIETNTLDQSLVTGLVGDLSNMLSQINARALLTDFNSLLNTIGLGSFTSTGTALTAIETRLENLTGTGTFDASQLFNITNIPQLLATSVAGIGGLSNIGVALQQTWDTVAGVAASGTGTLPLINTRLSSISTGGLLNAANLQNISNIPQLLASSVAGIGGAANIGLSLQQTWDTIANAATGAGTLPLINTRLGFLNNAGQFNAAQLFNIANLPQLTAASIPNITAAMSTDLQKIVDLIYQASYGGSSTGNPVSTVLTSLTNFPYQNVLGLLGPNQIGSALQATVDAIFMPLSGTLTTGNSLSALGNLFTAFLAIANNNTLLAQNNNTTIVNQAITKPSYLSVDPTADMVFPLSTMSGSTPTFVNVTAATSVIGMVGTPDGGIKESVMWLGQNTTNITAIILNLYSVNTTNGQLTLLYSSPNLIGSVPSALGWNYYTLPAASYLNTAQGDWYAVEMQVTGTGTYQVAGLPNHWLPANTAVYPQQLGAARNTLVTPSFDAASSAYTFNGNTTWSGGSLTITATAGSTVLLWVTAETASGGPHTSWTRTANYGGSHPMTSLGAVDSGGAGINSGWVECFALQNVPGGPQTVSFSVSGGPTATFLNAAAQAFSYINVGGLGSVVTNTGSGGTALSSGAISSAANQLIGQCFIGTQTSSGRTLSAYSGTSRFNPTGLNGNSWSLCQLAGDTVGAASTTVTATANAAVYWGSLSVPLLPGPAATPPTITAPTYSPNVPDFGLSGKALPAQMIPQTWSKTIHGTYSYPIPAWANHLDLIAVGGAGSGQTCALLAGEGGHAGVWASTTLNIGTDIPRSTTNINVTVGQGGAPSSQPGTATTLTATGWANGLSAAGGAGGSAQNGAINGLSPGNVTVNGIVYYGGLAETTPAAAGNEPGGGGSGAIFIGFAGGAGADGAALIRAYQ